MDLGRRHAGFLEALAHRGDVIRHGAGGHAQALVRLRLQDNLPAGCGECEGTPGGDPGLRGGDPASVGPSIPFNVILSGTEAGLTRARAVLDEWTHAEPAPAGPTAQPTCAASDQRPRPRSGSRAVAVTCWADPSTRTSASVVANPSDIMARDVVTALVVDAPAIEWDDGSVASYGLEGGTGPVVSDQPYLEACL